MRMVELAAIACPVAGTMTRDRRRYVSFLAGWYQSQCSPMPDHSIKLIHSTNRVLDMPQSLRMIVGAFVIFIACLPGNAWSTTLEVGTGKKYPIPSAAAAAAHDGDHITIAAGSYSDCAVWKANNLTIEGGAADTTVITGTPCAGKALFITQGNAITIRNLTLTGAHVAAFNGAGVRAEGGDLTIEHVRFINNEDGLLAGSLPGKQIIIRDSAFIGNGTCAGSGGCAHGIYVGNLGLLRVERSRFLGTQAGHHIKSRAQRTEVIGCSLADGTGGTSSFAVDVPNGGAVLLRDNQIQKGPRSDNHTAAVMIGAEGVTQPTPEIIVEHNTFLVDGDYSSYLVDNRTATEASLQDNTLRGNAMALHGRGTVR
jgi:hypothetical protein